MIRCEIIDLDSRISVKTELIFKPQIGDKIAFHNGDLYGTVFVHEIMYHFTDDQFSFLEIGVRDAQNTLRQSILNQSI